MVLAAGRGRSPQAQGALEELCRSYWYPLYACTQRRGCPAGEAEDLVQEFFAYLLSRDALGAADERRGRFRTFLLIVYQRFLGRQRQRARAQKRGGGRRIVSIEGGSVEERYLREPFHELGPERIYERRFALTLLENVLAQLKARYAARGRNELFALLKGTLTGEADPPTHAAIARQMNMSEGAVKAAAYRLRREYRDLLRDEIAQTVGGPDEIDDELNRLLAALGDAGGPGGVPQRWLNQEHRKAMLSKTG